MKPNPKPVTEVMKEKEKANLGTPKPPPGINDMHGHTMTEIMRGHRKLGSAKQ